MIVRLSRLHFPVTSLGPGRRVGLWFQGCSLQCPGCISVDTWDASRGEAGLDDLIARLLDYAPEAEGLTVSGGEPFEQPEALAAILAAWRAASPTDILVFTGLEDEELADWLALHPGLIDAMVTGPFRADLPQTRALRGSDNQRIRVLTQAGQAFAAYDRKVGEADRRLDLHFDGDGAWLAGIPARGDLARLRRLLAAAGHDVLTSDQIAAA